MMVSVFTYLQDCCLKPGVLPRKQKNLALFGLYKWRLWFLQLSFTERSEFVFANWRRSFVWGKFNQDKKVVLNACKLCMNCQLLLFGCKRRWWRNAHTKWCESGGTLQRLASKKFGSRNAVNTIRGVFIDYLHVLRQVFTNIPVSLASSLDTY